MRLKLSQRLFGDSAKHLDLRWGLTARPWIPVIVVALAILYLGYFGPEPLKAWIGFSEDLRLLNPNEDPSRAKVLWDWLQLLIIPGLLVAGGFWLSNIVDRARQSIEDQRAQDEALQAYLNHIGDLLLHESLRESQETDGVRKLARAQTLTVLRMLDPFRKGSVVQFLDETTLLQKIPRRAGTPVVSLQGADLSRAELSDAKLRFAYLRQADLGRADLRGARLNRADLKRADLRGADLSNAYLGHAKLNGAKLSGADLKHANLTGATVTQEQLDQAESLQGATMPNGQKYEDWLKDREGRGAERENPGPS